MKQKEMPKLPVKGLLLLLMLMAQKLLLKVWAMLLLRVEVCLLLLNPLQCWLKMVLSIRCPALGVRLLERVISKPLEKLLLLPMLQMPLLPHRLFLKLYLTLIMVLHLPNPLQLLLPKEAMEWLLQFPMLLLNHSMGVMPRLLVELLLLFVVLVRQVLLLKLLLLLYGEEQQQLCLKLWLKLTEPPPALQLSLDLQMLVLRLVTRVLL